MSQKEIRVPHHKIQNNQTIRQVLEDEFKKHDLDLHQHEVTHMEDDFKTGERILRVNNKKYVFLGD